MRELHLLGKMTERFVLMRDILYHEAEKIVTARKRYSNMHLKLYYFC